VHISTETYLEYSRRGGGGDSLIADSIGKNDDRKRLRKDSSVMRMSNEIRKAI